MRFMRIVNVIPNDHSNETNSDSETDIAVNPQNSREIVITAFTPPDSGIANGPVFFSTDGGENWALRFDVPGGMPNDQTVSFGSTSNELYVAVLQDGGQQLDVMRSADPSTGASFPILETRPQMDQPWVEAISVTTGPDRGKDRLYVGYNNDGLGFGVGTATVDVCPDALAGAPTFTPVLLETRTVGANVRDGYPIRPVAHPDGTVYAAYQRWTAGSFGSNITADMVVARDDNWATGGSPFRALTDPSDGLAGRLVATGVTINDGGTLGGERLNNDFAAAVDPGNSDVIYIAWADNAGPTYTIRVRRSLNRGVDWSGDLLTVDNATETTLAISSRGTVGLAYMQFVGGNWETHFRSTSDGTTWDDTLLARTATGGFIGDWMRLMAVGPHFYGVFPAMNTPAPANFFPNGGGTFRFQRNTAGSNLLGTDGTTVISASVDPFFYKIEEKDCSFIVNRDPIGQDEIDARRAQPRNSAGGLPVPDAFRVVVDGFTAAELGLTGSSSTLAMVPSVSPAAGLTVVPAGNASDRGDYGTEIQRFTFFYNLDFPDDSAFAFAGPSQSVTLSVTAGSVPASAEIELIKQPDPFMLHGDPSWLSVDLRVFVVRAGETKFGVTMGADASAAPGFIQQLIGTITPAQFQTLPTLEDDQQGKLFVQPEDVNGQRVFNFAIAQVHYIGQLGAANVRVFFRLFNAQSTSSAFETSTTYRRAASNPSGQPIPLAGIQGSDYVTIPCFATARVDTSTAGMDQQTDDFNRKNFSASTGSPEVDQFYGCWLDINQPFKPDGATANNVLPAQVPATQVDGPFTNAVPIQQAILRNLHQCLIAEIAFDPATIPAGKDTSNWDKLAQRNLAWSDVGSAEAVTTFEIRPTPAGLPAGRTPDELMIDWASTPSGSSAQIYLPAVNVADVLTLAGRMYTSHRLSRIDDHTLHTITGGISYIPIPPRAGPENYAGLLTVELPATAGPGETYSVAVRQVTNAVAQPTPPPPPEPQIGARAALADAVEQLEWRRVCGAFQLSIPVKARHHDLLAQEERDLAVLRWIAEAIPHHSRWYPVFHRYLEQIAGRVRTFGGDPTRILPSPTGDVKRRPPKPDEARHAFTGKIAGLIFDHFGDFEGFILETDEHQHRLHSRETDVAELAERAWRDRLRLTVFVDQDDPHRPLTIIIHHPPTPFDG